MRRSRLIKVICVIFSAMIVSYFFVLAYEYKLDNELLKFGDMKDANLSGKCFLQERDCGKTLLNNMLKRDELIILGSSELDSGLSANPSDFFPNDMLDYNVNAIGRPYVQDLLNAIRLGSLDGSLQGKKLIVILSLQWFIPATNLIPYEINLEGFNSNFSEIQFYDFMRNEKISSKIKKDVCKRVYELSKNEASLTGSTFMAFLNSQDNFFSSLVLEIFSPYYKLHRKLLSIKDKKKTLALLNEYKNKPPKVLRTIDWDEEEKKAEDLGRETCTNNNMYVNDKYYNEILRGALDYFENLYKNTDLMLSNEFQDYELLLKVCKEIGANPYIIMVPTNGFHYDFAGLDKEKRFKFYDKIESLAESYGFDFLDMREKEYEPYFFGDIMHLGWKGWLYVNKKIIEHYS